MKHYEGDFWSWSADKGVLDSSLYGESKYSVKDRIIEYRLGVDNDGVDKDGSYLEMWSFAASWDDEVPYRDLQGAERFYKQ